MKTNELKTWGCWHWYLPDQATEVALVYCDDHLFKSKMQMDELVGNICENASRRRPMIGRIKDHNAIEYNHLYAMSQLINRELFLSMLEPHKCNTILSTNMPPIE
jgi:hypothetical protein